MRISHVVRGQRPVTAEPALRLGRYFRQSPRFWLNLQSRYDMDVTEEALGELVEREVQPLRLSLEAVLTNHIMLTGSISKVIERRSFPLSSIDFIAASITARICLRLRDFRSSCTRYSPRSRASGAGAGPRMRQE